MTNPSDQLILCVTRTGKRRHWMRPPEQRFVGITLCGFRVDFGGRHFRPKLREASICPRCAKIEEDME